MEKAIILFNIGGPVNQDSVKPFLKSLFNDPAIIGLPQPFRFLLAQAITLIKSRSVKDNHKKMGGCSPLLQNTKNQAQALEQFLGSEIFVAMRHSPPYVDDVIKILKIRDPEKVILLPLFPQFSTTTTGSFLSHWKQKAEIYDFNNPTWFVHSYPSEPCFIKALSDLVIRSLSLFSESPWLLFSAHGLPKRILAKGDPYVTQIEKTVRSVLKELPNEYHWSLAYQSREGPGWTEPCIRNEIKRLGSKKKPLLVIPVSFVSENSETLVELDIQYKNLAAQVGIPTYYRVPTVSCHPLFIQGLAEIATRSLEKLNS